MTVHPIPPVYAPNSEILILGSFPSVKSREAMFFYGHKQNRFWKVTAAVFDCKVPETTDEKRDFLISNRIALWDVIKSCEISGSSDSSVKNVVPNDICGIIAESNIQKIFVNGKCAEKYYNKYLFAQTGMKCILLPSTSPANAAYSLEMLCNEWRKIRT